MKANTEYITKIMSEFHQIDISMFDESFISRTIASRSNELFFKNNTDYLSYLKRNSSESVILRESLNNSFSEFFRNPLTFQMLEQVVLPVLFNRKEKDKSSDLRIWSAGCAAGQEPYSLAIIAEDYKAATHKEIKIRIFGTDRNQKELNAASKGIYHFKSLQNVKLSQVMTCFSNSGEFYSINSNIREIVDFSLFDLLGEDSGSPPSSIYGDFEIVMCCNLLFYYKPEVQKKILTRLSKALAPGGFLVTGEAETAIVTSFRGFSQVNQLVPVFKKCNQ